MRQLSVFSLVGSARRAHRGQGLHLSRTMLSDQWSPYVGRFACDWHRLPGGCLSGNHRPGQEHPRIIATGRNAPSERSGRGQHTDLAGPSPSRTRAHSADVAPLVRTSSTRITRSGAAPQARNAPLRTRRRWGPGSLACGPVSTTRSNRGRTGNPASLDNDRVSASAWSYPRDRSRPLPSGTQLRMGFAPVARTPGGARARAWSIQGANPSATERSRPNLSFINASRHGP
jgi:hypothetical protein